MKKLYASFLIVAFMIPAYSKAWDTKTHMSISKAAGYAEWYNSAGADIAKVKAGSREGNNHYFENSQDQKITQKLVLEQVSRYNDHKDYEGHIYGAIIGAVREFEKRKAEGKYPDFHLAYLAHYAGDLTQPLHNMKEKGFIYKHLAFDQAVEPGVLDNIDNITKNMYEINLSKKNFEKDLAKEIARIANISIALGKKIKKEKRFITNDETYIQLGHSASLLKAVLKYLGRI